MDKSLTLRPVTPDDLPFLQRVYAGTRMDELALTDWDEAHKTAFIEMQFSAQHEYYTKNYRGAQFQIVVLNGEPIGRLYVDRWADQIRIIDIALLPEQRGRGVGSELLKQILDEGRRLNLPVTIHVERFNPALHLYERLGFQLLEDKGVYWLLKWTPV